MFIPTLLPLVTLLSSGLTAPTPQDVVDEVAPLISPCVQPTLNLRVFVRCFDTHSSVHAHWAAYRIARFDDAHVQLALDSAAALEPQKLMHEVNQWVTYQYAQAWYLLLATEFEKWGTEHGLADPQRMRPSAEIAAEELRAQLASPGAINPNTGDYGSDSWALAQLHQWYAFIGATAELAEVQGWIEQHFMGTISGPHFGQDLNSPRFFSTYGNWQFLIESTQAPRAVEQWQALQSPIPDAHLVVNNTPQVHSYGLGWSRVWALQVMARCAQQRTDRLRYWRSAAEHMRVGMLRHAQQVGNFAGYDHWVPQFMVFGATAGLDL